MGRKEVQLISRGSRTLLVRISLGRDPEARIRKYHNKTIRGLFLEAQTYLSESLKEREIGRLPRAAATSTWISGSQRHPSRDSGRKATSITKRCYGCTSVQF